MVCLGNICRSPMAEGILRHKLSDLNIDVEIDSAGTGNYHIGAHPDHRAVKCLKQKGIDISTLRARQFVYQDFTRFDIIYAMDASNYKNIVALAKTDAEKSNVKMYLNEAWPGQDRAVPDPWFGDADGFEEVFEMLEAASEACAKSLKVLD